MPKTTPVLATALLFLLAPSFVRAQEDSMTAPRFVVWKHMNGTLALATSEIRGVWFQAAFAGKPAQLRVTSPALVEPKTLSGADAEALWSSFHDGALAPLFLFVPHMGGTLGIPRDQVRTLFFSDEGGKTRLRIGYDGDPNGKDLEGDDARAVWKELAPSTGG